jgi:raffinose/stachyose/melibiose transport system substrate-binding protein
MSFLQKQESTRKLDEESIICLEYLARQPYVADQERNGKNMRHSVIRAAAAVLSAILVLGFASGRSMAQTTLRIWTPWPSYADIFEKLKAEFRKTHPDITVETTEMPEAEYRAAVKSALAANAGPDIVTAVPGRTGMNFFADAGAIVDLTPYYQKYNWAAHYPKWITDDLTYTTKSGHKGMWVLPTHVATTFLFYDPQFFQSRHWDVPKTLDQFLDYCKTANAAGVIPLAFGDGAGGWMAVEYISYLLNQTAGDAGVDALVNGKSSSTAPDIVKAAEILARLRDGKCFQPGVVSTAPPTALALWIGGKAGMVYTGDWSFADVERQGPALYARMRLIPGQQINAAVPMKPTSALGDSLAITSFSKARDAAVAWLNFMASETGQSMWLKDAKRIVARTALNTEANGASAVQTEDVKLLEPGTSVDLDYPLWPQTYSALEKALQNVLDGSQTPAAALQTVQQTDQQQWHQSSP